MRLLLVRHAIAEERDPRRWPRDDDRPLTQRGIRRFRLAALGLGSLVPAVDAVLTSPFVRAHQTATILEDQLGWPAPVARSQLASGAPLEGAIKLLGECEAKATVVVVGHEPTMSQLTSAIAGSTPSRLMLDWRRGGAALIDFGRSAAVNAGTLRWFLPPRVMRSLTEQAG